MQINNHCQIQKKSNIVYVCSCAWARESVSGCTCFTSMKVLVDSDVHVVHKHVCLHMHRNQRKKYGWHSTSTSSLDGRQSPRICLCLPTSSMITFTHYHTRLLWFFLHESWHLNTGLYAYKATVTFVYFR